MIPFLITQNGTSMFLNGEHLVVPLDHPNYDKIVEALREGRTDEIPGLYNLSKAVESYFADHSDLTLVGGLVTLNGFSFPDEVSRKVLDMIEAGNHVDPLVNFLRKVRENPSSIAQKELLLFCVANGFMIHEDGDILAYKAVRSDYKDSYSGTFDNSVGQVVKMNRGDVNDDRNMTCSHGLHFAAFEYASGFTNGHLMVIKVNPKNVVSIPSDYNNQKGRCCEYTVYAEVSNWKPLVHREVYYDHDFDPDGDSDIFGYDNEVQCWNCGEFNDSDARSCINCRCPLETDS